MKVDIEEIYGASLCLVRLGTIELNFKNKTEAETFVKRLQARLDAPHLLPHCSNAVLSEPSRAHGSSVRLDAPKSLADR